MKLRENYQGFQQCESAACGRYTASYTATPPWSTLWAQLTSHTRSPSAHARCREREIFSPTWAHLGSEPHLGLWMSVLNMLNYWCTVDACLMILLGNGTTLALHWQCSWINPWSTTLVLREPSRNHQTNSNSHRNVCRATLGDLSRGTLDNLSWQSWKKPLIPAVSRSTEIN